MFNVHVFEPIRFVRDDARLACSKPSWQERILYASLRIMWPDSNWREVVNAYREYT